MELRFQRRDFYGGRFDGSSSHRRILDGSPHLAPFTLLPLLPPRYQYDPRQGLWRGKLLSKPFLYPVSLD